MLAPATSLSHPSPLLQGHLRGSTRRALPLAAGARATSYALCSWYKQRTVYHARSAASSGFAQAQAQAQAQECATAPGLCERRAPREHQPNIASTAARRLQLPPVPRKACKRAMGRQQLREWAACSVLLAAALLVLVPGERPERCRQRRLRYIVSHAAQRPTRRWSRRSDAFHAIPLVRRRTRELRPGAVPASPNPGSPPRAQVAPPRCTKPRRE